MYWPVHFFVVTEACIRVVSLCFKATEDFFFHGGRAVFTHSENTEKYCVCLDPSDKPSTVKIDHLIEKLKWDTHTHAHTHKHTRKHTHTETHARTHAQYTTVVS